MHTIRHLIWWYNTFYCSLWQNLYIVFYIWTTMMLNCFWYHIATNNPLLLMLEFLITMYDDVTQWKHFPRYWPIVRGIHRSPVNSPHKGQWRGALMFSLICTWINGCVNNCETGGLRRHRAHYDVTVMCMDYSVYILCCSGVLCKGHKSLI